MFEQLLSITIHKLSVGCRENIARLLNASSVSRIYFCTNAHLCIFCSADRETRESFAFTVVSLLTCGLLGRVEFIVGVSAIECVPSGAANQFLRFQILAIVHCELQITQSLRKLILTVTTSGEAYGN